MHPNAFAIAVALLAGSTLVPTPYAKETIKNESSLAIEDAADRARLPEYKWIPAATKEELTYSTREPKAETFTTWTRSHGDNGSRRYSALTQINRENISDLKVAWTYRSGDGKGNVQCNPIIVANRLIGPTGGGNMVALDAKSGLELWRFDVPHPERRGLADDPARRGLLYWPGDNKSTERIVFTSGDFVYSLNPANGKPVEEFGEQGSAIIPTGGTAAGAVYKSVLVLPGLQGDIFGYDIRTGKRVWTFRTIPDPDEFGGDTWTGESRDGAHCWGGMSLDESTGISYFAIGAPRTDFIGVDRLGDNLFANCVLALDTLTGKRIWHYQHIRHDIWDMDLPAAPSLVTLKRDGKDVAAIACITKSGDTILLDRGNGKPIFPIRMRRAPTSSLPGERTAPYQPDLVLPEPFSEFEFRPSEITDRTPTAHAYVKSVVDRSNYGFFPTFELGKPTLMRSTRGGGEWSGQSIDMENGRMYVTSNHMLSIITVVRNDEPERPSHVDPTQGEKIYEQYCMACHDKRRRGIGTAPPLIGLRHRLDDEAVRSLLKTGRGSMPPMPQLSESDISPLIDFLMRRDLDYDSFTASKSKTRLYTHLGYNFLKDDEGYPGTKPPWGKLNCLDLNTGKIIWSAPLGEYEELTRRGTPKTGTPNLGGATVTAGGLVFCAGTDDERIRAFDKDTGAELWSAKLPFGGYAAPSVYQIDGKQYVVITATGGGKVGGPTGDAYVAFSLP